MVVSEMIASWAMIRENRNTLRMAEVDGCGGVSALQLAGCEPAAMAEAARLAVDQRRRPDRHQFRLPGEEGGGRPARRLRADARRGRRRRASWQATVRRRPGAGDAEDAHGLGPCQPERAAPGAHRRRTRGIRMVTVHGRTRQQFYTGTADWDFIAPGEGRRSAFPVIVNGDILTEDDAADGAAPLRRRRRDDRPRLLRPARGSPPRSRISCAPARRLPEPPLARAESHLAARITTAMLQPLRHTTPGVRLARKHVVLVLARPARLGRVPRRGQRG